MADGYIIHVPKGHLESYQNQWTGNAGHFEEFEFMIADRPSVRRTVNISSVSVEVKNAFVHTDFDSELQFQTQFLQKPEERPFLHTQEWLKTIEIESATQSEDSDS